MTDVQPQPAPGSLVQRAAAAEPPTSTAYAMFHPRLQQWVHRQGWTALRPAQELAAPIILGGDRDLIVAAATATGKTEAAWLPVCSALLSDPSPGGGVKALYVSPLKALINDQHDRLNRMCENLGIAVHRWHGDVAASRKAALVKAPDGLLLITPESLEALFVTRGTTIGAVLAGLRYVVIDEFHSFIGTERGAQLQSLLHRVELLVRRRVPRIALSATLGSDSPAGDIGGPVDVQTAQGHGFAAAQRFLRPGGHPGQVAVVATADHDRELRLQLRGYVNSAPAGAELATDAGDGDDSEPESWAELAIAEHLHRTLCGTDNLVFVRSRTAVETYTDRLARIADAASMPSPFLPHHGNLSKDLREHVEARLKDRATPVTAICTSTLEMGIDIGSVHSVAQVGAPPTVASLRQRLGRSGRRDGEPAIVRVYLAEDAITPKTPPPDLLRTELVQTIATIDLLLRSWYEPPDLSDLHLSTLVQQILSIIAQRGGAQPAALYNALCGHGPFHRVTRDIFVTLLRAMGVADLITQAGDGLLLAGGVGDRIVNHYTFYSAFQTAEEYRIVAAGRTLGSLPVDQPLTPGTLLIFGGRRWKIIDVDTTQRVIDVAPSSGGKPPRFAGAGGEIADAIRRRMFAIYTSPDVPRYLDRTAQHLLAEGRDHFDRLGLHQRAAVEFGEDMILFPFRGDRITNTLAILLQTRGLVVGKDGAALTIGKCTVSQLRDAVDDLLNSPPPNPAELASTVLDKASGKYDEHLGDDLLNLAYAARSLDVPGALSQLERLAGKL